MKQSLIALLVRAYVFPAFPASFEDKLKMMALENIGTPSFWEYTKMHPDFPKHQHNIHHTSSTIHRTGKRHK